jgi:phage-related protein
LPLLKGISDFVLKTFVPGVGAMVAAFKAGGDDITSSGFAGVMERIGLAARSVVDWLTGTAVPAIKNFATSFVIPAAITFAGFLTGTLIPGLISLVGWLRDNSAWLLPIAVGVGAMLAAYKAYTIYMDVVKAVTAAYAVVQGVLNAVMAANPISLVILAVVGLAAGLIYAYKTSETFRDVVNTVFTAIKVVIGNVVSIVIELFRHMLDTWTTVIGGLLSAAATIAEKLHLPFAASMRKASDAFNGMAAAADAKLKEVANSASKWGDQTGKNFTAGIGGSLRSVADMATLMGAQVARGFASGIAANSALAVMAAQSMAGKAQAAMAANLAPPSHRAAGGPVMAGQSYIVGENRPELFVPTQNGMIIPQVPTGHGGGGNADVVAAIASLQATIAAMPKTYQMGQRQMAGTR